MTNIIIFVKTHIVREGNQLGYYLILRGMASYVNYLFSVRKPIYKKIATQYKCSGFHVYCLAHGKKTKRGIDDDIIDRLIMEGIVSGRKHGARFI